MAKIVEVHGDGRAVVEHESVEDAGRREEVLLMTVQDDDIEPGDWVLIHSGFVLERISAEHAADALAIRATPPDASADPASYEGAEAPGEATPAGAPEEGVAP
ncbi:MAG: HypC/HybG/HupF family hydrogenase formation chaperone [Demequinaceae bacterium]|nr:HypC/HybG/HupF family hydrogenase formation chaperone [Demequinaceae bacterium]